MGVLSGVAYTSGIVTHAGEGMVKFVYSCACMGILPSRVISNGYAYGMALPSGYVIIAIPSMTLWSIIALHFNNRTSIENVEGTMMIYINDKERFYCLQN